MGLAFKSVDEQVWMVPLRVGGPRSSCWRPGKNHRLRDGDQSLGMTVFKLGRQPPPAFRPGLGLDPGSPPLCPAWLDCREAGGSPGPPPCQVKTLDSSVVVGANVM